MDRCMGDWRPGLVLLAIILIPIICGSPASFILGWRRQFVNGYQDGYNCAQDTFANPEDRTEGFYDYWLGTKFWFQQGHKEGYKKGARDYVNPN